MHIEPARTRLKLVLVAILALASLGALLVARPALGGDVWMRGVDVAFVAAWVVALLASAWLFVATGLCVVALGFRRPALARRLAPTLPAGVRKLVEVSIAGSLIAFPALPAVCAHAASPAPVPTVILADQPVIRAPAPAPPPAPTLPATIDHVVVRAGDNLWLIARTTVARATGSQPSEREIARYWHALIAANRSTLRSGNPSLIFPGEIVTLPPPSPVS